MTTTKTAAIFWPEVKGGFSNSREALNMQACRPSLIQERLKLPAESRPQAQDSLPHQGVSREKPVHMFVEWEASSEDSPVLEHLNLDQ